MHLQDNQGRTALHMACWGKYGGRLRKKASSHPTDAPECAKLLLEKGADPNFPDYNKKSPLCIAAATGGDRCIELLLHHGANIHLVDHKGSTSLHQAFYRGTLDCIKKLIPNGVVASLVNRWQFLPIECLFRDDMSETL